MRNLHEPSFEALLQEACETLQYLASQHCSHRRAKILVANKVDLQRCRAVTKQGGHCQLCFVMYYTTYYFLCTCVHFTFNINIYLFNKIRDGPQSFNLSFLI